MRCIVNERSKTNLLVHNACHGAMNTKSESVCIIPSLKMPLRVTVYQTPDGGLGGQKYEIVSILTNALRLGEISHGSLLTSGTS